MLESDVIEFARTQLTLPDKLDPADEMSWQHYLYSKLGKKEKSAEIIVEQPKSGANEKIKSKEQIIQETVERIVAMAKVLFGLHMVIIVIVPDNPSTQNTILYIFLNLSFKTIILSFIHFIGFLFS